MIEVKDGAWEIRYTLDKDGKPQYEMKLEPGYSIRSYRGKYLEYAERGKTRVNGYSTKSELRRIMNKKKWL